MRRSGRIVATIRFSDLFFSVTIEKLSLLINIYTQIFESHSDLSQIPPDSHISGILTRHTLIQRSKGRTLSPPAGDQQDGQEQISKFDHRNRTEP